MNGYERRVLMHVHKLKQDAFHAAVKTAMHDERKAKLEKSRLLSRFAVPLVSLLERDNRFTAAVLNLEDQGLLMRRTETNEGILARQASDTVHAPGGRGRTYYVLTPRAMQIVDSLPAKQKEGLA